MAIGISQPTSLVLDKLRFQRNYLWDVYMPDISLNFGGLEGLAVSQLVQSITFGDYNINPVVIKYGPYQAHYAGIFEVNKVTIGFVKTMPDVISSYFDAWKGLIIDSRGLYQVKSVYQKTIYVRFIDSTGLAVGKYSLIGSFPISFPSYNLDYKNDDVTYINVDFNVDKIEYTAL